MINTLQQQAFDAIRERRDLEGAEAGRRQNEGLSYPDRD
jgi:hypothetical protein